VGCWLSAQYLSKSKNSGKRKHKTKDKQPSVIPRGFSELWDLLGFQTSAWHLTSQHVPTGGWCAIRKHILAEPWFNWCWKWTTRMPSMCPEPNVRSSWDRGCFRTHCYGCPVTQLCIGLICLENPTLPDQSGWRLCIFSTSITAYPKGKLHSMMS
jgi:hypothetical protein